MSKSSLSSALFLDCVENSYIHSIRWLKCNRNRIYNRFNFILENMLNLNNLWNYSFDFFFLHHWTFYRSEDCCFSAIRFSPIVKLSSLASFIQTPKIYVISISYCYLEHAGDFFCRSRFICFLSSHVDYTARIFRINFRTARCGQMTYVILVFIFRFTCHDTFENRSVYMILHYAIVI